MDVLLLKIHAAFSMNRANDVLMSALMRVLQMLRTGKIRLLKRMLTFTAISAVYATVINFQFVRKSSLRRLIAMALTILYSDKYVFYSPNTSNRLQLVLACVAVSCLNKVSSRSRRTSATQRQKLQDDHTSIPSVNSGAFLTSARWREAQAPAAQELEEDGDPQISLLNEEKIQFFIAKFVLKKFQGELSVEDLRELFDQLTHMVVEGPVVWKGSPNGMYVIRRGVLGIYKGDALLTRLTRGESTGDLRVLCPMTDVGKSPLECRIISGPAHLSFISAEDFESHMRENIGTLKIYVSASIGTYWRLVRFVLQNILLINEANLSLDVLATDVQDIRHLPTRRIMEGIELTFEPDSAAFLARGSLMVNDKLVHSPAIIGAAALLTGLQPSATVRCVGAKNCYVSDIKEEHLCYYHTLVGLASLLVHDCDLFMRLGLSRHFIPQGRPLPEDCHLLVGGRLGARSTRKNKNKSKWLTDNEASIQEIGGVTLVGAEYLHERSSDMCYFALRDCECVSITRMYHHRGLLWKYVRASMTVIGILPPVWDDGDLLVDGGYLDNLPVLYMREILGPQSTIIAVDVENKDVSEFESVSPYEDGLSGMYLFTRRMLTFLFGAKPFRHPAQESLISQLTYAEHIVRLEHCLQTDAIDLYIRPPFLDSVWLLDYHLVKKLERRGYLHSRGCLEQFYSGSDSARDKEDEDEIAALNITKFPRMGRRSSEILPVSLKCPIEFPRRSPKIKAGQNKQPLLIRSHSVQLS
eukprot:GEMP01012311.1.p1 GENE.GEMP01012311.1~~GEMP01012311.1.p1  ORF type:complete len:753 (+),score=129.64 GEMP01012311.1:168-2426(+)